MDVLDSVTDLVTHRTTREWLPRQLAPATTNQLLGLPQGAGQRTLQLANPGDNVVRAQVKVVTADTSFTPNGLAPVSVPPGATVRVPLSAELDEGAAATVPSGSRSSPTSRSPPHWSPPSTTTA